MRITQDLLIKIARQTVAQRKRSEPDLHAAYLTGAILQDRPLLGGTADIDLVLVHKYQSPVAHETVAVTPEVSLDIYHKVRDVYDQHRQLRQDPWLGYPLTYNHILLFDTAHWLEFIQSSVSADFHRPDNVLARVNALLSAAREGWFSILQKPPATHQQWLDQYLKIIYLTANAVAGLIGPPLFTRRFMLDFNERIENLGVPNFLAGFMGLLGLSAIEGNQLSKFIDAFEEDLLQVQNEGDPPAHLAACRKPYYLAGIHALAESGAHQNSLWPLLRTWVDVHLVGSQPLPGVQTWKEFLTSLDLTEKTTHHKHTALDHYLDQAEIIIEAWADTYGF